ncbi:MAG: alpha/beta hydrolase, partial [Actinomycetota bacterium]|nr:alpha/beta hydrolase [Actinomycetota bacterium]
MAYVEGAGVALHYLVRGEGPAVLMVHGMASDGLAWEPALEQLAAAGLRAIALDRRGYGSSGAPEPYTGTTVQEQAEDAAALLHAVDGAP